MDLYANNGLAPGPPAHAVMLARLAPLDAGSRLLDLGCGAYPVSLWPMRQLGCRGTLVDKSARCLDEAQRQAADWGLGDRASFRCGLAETFLAESHPAAYDLVFATGGLPSYLGVRRFLDGVRRLITPAGHIVFSLTTLRGYSESSAKMRDAAAPPPPEVTRFYGRTVMNPGGRELLVENELRSAIEASGFRHVLSFNLPTSYWGEFYRAIARAPAGSPINFTEDDAFHHHAAIYETYLNAVGRHHIDYGYYLAQVQPGEESGHRER